MRFIFLDLDALERDLSRAICIATENVGTHSEFVFCLLMSAPVNRFSRK